MIVSIDGRIVPARDAAISVLDHGFLYGDGVFEGIRIYGRCVFRLDDHMARLAVSARAIGLALPGGVAAIREVVLATAAAADADEAYVRIVVTRGAGPLGVDPTGCENPRVVCIVDQLDLFPPERALRGVTLVTSSLRRPALDAVDPRVKSLNYLNNVLAKREARSRGADDAILLNARGTIAEASGANLFIVRSGRLLTPPANDGALDGITRDTVLELACKLGIATAEVSLSRVDLLAADEAFLTGTGARLVPVRELDGELIGESVPGPMTLRLHRAFLEHAPTRGVRVPASPIANSA